MFIQKKRPWMQLPIEWLQVSSTTTHTFCFLLCKYWAICILHMEPTFVVGSTVSEQFVFWNRNVHLMCDILKMKFKCSTFIRFSITVITASLTANSIWLPMSKKLNASLSFMTTMSMSNSSQKRQKHKILLRHPKYTTVSINIAFQLSIAGRYDIQNLLFRLLITRSVSDLKHCTSQSIKLFQNSMHSNPLEKVNDSFFPIFQIALLPTKRLLNALKILWLICTLKLLFSVSHTKWQEPWNKLHIFMINIFNEIKLGHLILKSQDSKTLV